MLDPPDTVTNLYYVNTKQTMQFSDRGKYKLIECENQGEMSRHRTPLKDWFTSGALFLCKHISTEYCYFAAKFTYKKATIDLK